MQHVAAVQHFEACACARGHCCHQRLDVSGGHQHVPVPMQREEPAAKPRRVAERLGARLPLGARRHGAQRAWPSQQSFGQCCCEARGRHVGCEDAPHEEARAGVDEAPGKGPGVTRALHPRETSRDTGCCQEAVGRMGAGACRGDERQARDTRGRKARERERDEAAMAVPNDVHGPLPPHRVEDRQGQLRARLRAHVCTRRRVPTARLVERRHGCPCRKVRCQRTPVSQLPRIAVQQQEARRSR